MAKAGNVEISIFTLGSEGFQVLAQEFTDGLLSIKFDSDELTALQKDYGSFAFYGAIARAMMEAVKTVHDVDIDPDNWRRNGNTVEIWETKAPD